MKRYQKPSIALNLCIVGWLIPILPAQAASFDCGKARTEIEKLICTHADLSEEDKLLAEFYKGALSNEQQADTIRQSQKQWLKERNDCPDIACLRRMYTQRREILQPLAYAMATPHMFGTPQPISSGPYTFKLEKETGWNVCQDYVKSLEMLQPTTEALTCEVNIAPNMPQFSRPDWQELNIEEHWDIIYTIETELKLGREKNPSPIDIWRDNYLARIQKGEIKPRLRQARLRFSSDEPEETFFGYTRDHDNIETCKKKLFLKYSTDTGDTLYYREPVSNKLLPVFPDTRANFSGNSENQVFLHNSTLYLISPDQQYSVISRLFKIKPINPKTVLPLRYFGQNICQINARPTQTAQP